ncbi:MAG: hypothetical protein DRJ40_05540 [Thermoprotei archaeon]|nr:MAG: hypothetical protein DRJ40_03985 [Thermoprotei archaeon]RLE56855.1 MAG: hypothetical protein DRJ40_05540 [Thermoprotei archaeon]
MSSFRRIDIAVVETEFLFAIVNPRDKLHEYYLAMLDAVAMNSIGKVLIAPTSFVELFLVHLSRGAVSQFRLVINALNNVIKRVNDVLKRYRYQLLAFLQQVEDVITIGNVDVRDFIFAQSFRDRFPKESPWDLLVAGFYERVRQDNSGKIVAIVSGDVVYRRLGCLHVSVKEFRRIGRVKLG